MFFFLFLFVVVFFSYIFQLLSGSSDSVVLFFCYPQDFGLIRIGVDKLIVEVKTTRVVSTEAHSVTNGQIPGKTVACESTGSR